MANTSPLCTRLTADLDDEVRGFFARHTLGPSQGLRRIIEEWVTLQRYPALEFREGVFGRRAALRHGPEVWEIVSISRRYGPDRERLYAHFSWLDAASIDQALEFYKAMPDDVDRILAENERIARGALRSDTEAP
jgi:uncharacterized protein (DUF433 family)